MQGCNSPQGRGVLGPFSGFEPFVTNDDFIVLLLKNYYNNNQDENMDDVKTMFNETDQI